MTKFNKPVMIKMKSVQNTGGESTEVELITEGTLSFDSGKYTVSYKDSEATGFEDSVTSVILEKQELASVIRVGNAPSNLVLEKNKKHHCHYGTPYGDMMVGIFAHNITNELNENGGNIYLRYTIDINSSYISDNEIIMEVSQI